MKKRPSAPSSGAAVRPPARNAERADFLPDRRKIRPESPRKRPLRPRTATAFRLRTGLRLPERTRRRGERSDGFARAAVAGGAAQPGLSQPQGARLPGSAAPARGPLPQDRPRQPADLKQSNAGSFLVSGRAEVPVAPEKDGFSAGSLRRQSMKRKVYTLSGRAEVPVAPK